MPYRLRDSESVSDGLRRCAREQLDTAIEKLTDDRAADPVKAVHDARKALKKERSLLRLARGTLRGSQRRRENAAFRDAARQLSDVRDADVLLQSLDQLVERYAEEAPQATLMTIRARLEEQRKLARSGADHANNEEEVAAELEAARERIADWSLEDDGFSAVRKGLDRSYRDGRRAMRRARSEPTVENLHDWRKRCKDLWYHTRLLRPIAPNVLAGHADDAHQLSDLLGDDHDLALLAETIERSEHAIPSNTDVTITLIEQRRLELREQAFRTGRRLYAERPKAFMRRMRSYWDSWEPEAPKPRSRNHSSVSATPS